MVENLRTIIVDAMGGDHGSSACVSGAVQAITERESPLKIILVGDEAEIRAEIQKHHLNGHGQCLEIVHAPDVVHMYDAATDGMRKKDSSINVATRLHKEGRGDAVVSTGHTGAFMAAGLANLGRLPGVSRPAIACLFPSESGKTLVLDVGANPVCKPQNLVEFGIMGAVYSHEVMGVESPRVGLLSNGEEPSKGTELTINSHRIFQLCKLNFIGNIEGRDILRGRADVVVCDGFVGNIMLKFAESLQGFLTNAVHRQISHNKFSHLGAILMGPFLRRMKKTFDYAEYGGAPLLGLAGVCTVCHGASSPKAIRNAIWASKQGVDHHINEEIAAALSQGTPSLAEE